MNHQFQYFDRSRKELAAIRSCNAANRYFELARNSALDCQDRATEFYLQRAQDAIDSLPNSDDNLGYLAQEMIDDFAVSSARKMFDIISMDLNRISDKIKLSLNRREEIQ